EEKVDVLAVDGKNKGYMEIRKGDFLVCYTEDAHMTGIKVLEKENIKKAIFKVLVR
ncbi:YhcH/YjgK/YiaL family protein, partial [Clostridioides difficile]|nr:YhcH/YjgK/YiaL family protein [Clostridioides difficile]